MIVLASSSPRRRELLQMLGISFEVDPPEIPEEIVDGEQPSAMVARLAAEKVVAVARRRPGDLVLGADTTVVLDGDVLGKPVSPEDATEMLRRLSGKRHQVLTAVAAARDDFLETRLDTTAVSFRQLDAGFIDDYVKTGEPLDKAGSYGIQGYGAALVERIEGDFFSVMGFPVRLVIDLMDKAGVPYRFTR
ncbi:MAG: Maf family protein [Gemmatimonadetes bacterium]|nr:Maf family protein [Gemmatimonadota bacterium]